MIETLKVAVKYNKKLFIKFSASFAVCVFGILALALTASALEAGGETGIVSEEPAPTESSALYELIGVDASQPLEIILLITVLSVAPSILLMMTSFTRIIIIFGFLRNAMNTQTTPPNQVLVGLALFLTMFIMWPVFAQINDVAYRPYSNGEITAWEALEKAGEPLKTFMLKQTTDSNMMFFMDLAQAVVYDIDEDGNQIPRNNFDGVSMETYQEQLSLQVVIPAFMISELARAFQMGFLLFIPFLIIDIVVSSTLMSMGMMMLPPAMISLPFKIMIFVIVDGWRLLVGTVISSFNM
ncbi:MAG: flagellar type III secretion system pore protein FliP [Oscillospiraceae bacterium]|jgi:flagellar biosynthetic protein FliP|nr:flagellar type III secretion system pore protein FliP [Oscillospiraceae bacterium]